MKLISSVFLLASLMLAPISSQSATISLLANQATIPVGSILQMSLVISGLGDHSAPSLGAFDLDLTYDNNLLSLTDFSYGKSLGDDDLGEALTITDTTTPGRINLTELSFLESNPSSCNICLSPYLEDLQGNSFTLANLSFQTIQNGPAVFGLSINSSVDGNSDLLPTTVNALPQVNIAPVPVPSAIWLFMSAYPVLGLFRRQRKLAG